MRRDFQALVRQLLHDNPDGLTISEMMTKLKSSDEQQFRRALRHMADVYIDRWVFSSKGPSAAVWCAVYVPPDCPRPPKGYRTQEQIEKAKDKARMRFERERDAREDEKKLRADLRQLANLTTIRGSWPYANNQH